jgi:hypothetical protein
MKTWTKIRLGLAKPTTVASAASILKRLWPQHRIPAGLQGGYERPAWAVVAYSRGWMSERQFVAVRATVKVESAFYRMVGAQAEPFDMTSAEWWRLQIAYPEPGRRKRR